MKHVSCIALEGSWRRRRSVGNPLEEQRASYLL